MTTFFSTLSLLTVILYIGPALEYLPKAIFIVSFLLTVCYDMAEGLTLSALFSAFTIVFRDQWPKWHFLTHDEELNEYKEAERKQQFLQHQIAAGGHAFIIRYDAPLIFTSVLIQSAKKRKIQLNLCRTYSATEKLVLANYENTLIIDCSGFPYVDFLGLQTLKKVF
ncbi:unnamed protein product [Meloidogyne enterolobii]|uniref:Uncharacterized protein n=1 Tax=Meloidogyne enterolobii TaxID=390850 RepID=A0ACB1AI46_MELEN